MNLEKVKLLKESTLVDISRQAVVVHVKLCEPRQQKEFRWESSGEVIKVKIEEDQGAEVANFTWDRPS
jgi:hypothetical protein